MIFNNFLLKILKRQMSKRISKMEYIIVVLVKIFILLSLIFDLLSEKKLIWAAKQGRIHLISRILEEAILETKILFTKVSLTLMIIFYDSNFFSCASLILF